MAHLGVTAPSNSSWTRKTSLPVIACLRCYSTRFGFCSVTGLDSVSCLQWEFCRSSSTYLLPRVPALSDNQWPSLVVPEGVAPDVGNSAIKPSTSSLVGTTSRSIRPTTLVRAKLRNRGVRTNRTAAHRRGQQAKQVFAGERIRPGSIGDDVLTLRAGRHRQARQDLGIDGLDLVITVPENVEDGNPPQRPSYVVQQQVALAEDLGRPDMA